MNNDNDKYIIAIVVLSVLLIVTLILGLFSIKNINDLRDTANMYKNSKEIYRMELEELTNEYEKFTEDLCKNGKEEGL